MSYSPSSSSDEGGEETLEAPSHPFPVGAAESSGQGRWSEAEQKAFQEGVRLHGKGQWTLISALIPTR